MKKKSKCTRQNNFPWLIFITGIVLLCFSLAFKAYDMAVICVIPIIGSFVLFGYSCWQDIKNARKKG